MALGNRVGTAHFDIIANMAGFGDSVTAGVVNALTARTAVLGGIMESLGKKLFTRFTLPLAAATTANVAQFAALERNIAEVLTLFGTAPALVDEHFGAMRDGIRAVSEEVGGLEREIAEGLYQTISAGVPSEGAFEFLNVAQMAAIADRTADLETAVDGITTAINAYGLEATDAERVSDIFFATVARGKTTFGELADDIGRVAPLAANAGVSLEETSAIIGQLTVNGLKTSEAISFLRAAITGLLRPGDEMNEIFQEVGFATAEAAVPVLGLQGAFQVVVDAARGSTSRLQELIGTSEGVTAVLGITGENAAQFASILGTVENSAGSTSRAFEIVDGTVSRSFGRMTEAFDRLGNTFGALASEFIQPLVDLITDVVTSLAQVFEHVAPLARNLGEVFGTLLSVFDTPVLGTALKALIAIGITLSGILGILAPLLIVVGNFLVQLVLIRTISTLWRAFSTVIVNVGVAVEAVALGITNLGTVLARQSVPAVSALGTAFQRLGAILANPIAAFGIATVAILAISAAIAGALILWSKWRDAQRAAHEANQTNSIGLDRLAESVGAVRQELQLLVDDQDEATTSAEAFRFANADLIREIEQLQERLGAEAAEEFIIGLAAQLSFEGISPDEIQTIVDNLAEQLGLEIELPVAFEDFGTLESNLERLSGRFTGLERQSESIAEIMGQAGPGTEARAELDDLAQGMADAFVAAQALGETDAWINMARQVEENLPSHIAQDELFEGILQNLETIEGEKFGISLSGLDDLESFVQELENVGRIGPGFVDFLREGLEAEIEIPTIKAPSQEDLQTIIGTTTGFATDLVTLTNQILEEVRPEQVAAFQSLQEDIPLIFEAGEAAVNAHIDAIESRLFGTLPLVQEYTGAVDLAFSDWKKSQDAFQRDVPKIISFRAIIKERFEGVAEDIILAEFDKLPTSQQAWLATLNADQMEAALVEMAASAQILADAAEETIAQETPEILEAANTAMDEQWQVMIDRAEEAGGLVPALFEQEFAKQAPQAIADARAWVDELNAILGVDLEGPTIRFDPGFRLPEGVGTTNVTINNPTTQNPGRDARLALLGIQGAS